MKQTHVLTGAAVAAGLLGAVVRRWAQLAAFDQDTGLVDAGHPAILALLALTALAAAGLLLACRRCPNRLKQPGYDTAFYAPETLSLAVSSSAAILVGLSAMLTLTDAPLLYAARLSELELSNRGALSGGLRLQAVLYAAPELLQGLLGLAAAVCMFFLARGRAGGRWRSGYTVAALIPGFFACLWLINAYRDKATDPVVLSYGWHLLAIICVVLALYYAAGFSYRNVRPRLTLYFSLLGVFACLTTLADPHQPAELLALAAFLLWLAASASALLHNLLGLSHGGAALREKADVSRDRDDDDDDDVDIIL